MNKFIIFKLKEVTPAGASFSDDGTGIEVISTPVESIAYMTASLGQVNIFFRDVSPYEESNLSTGESTQRSFVTVSCDEGEEIELMKSISVFSNSKTTNPFLLFDATSSPTFGRYGENIKAFLKDHPVNRVTGEVSIQTDNSFTASTANTVNDIDYGAQENKPVLDLDCRDATYSASVLATWVNSGTGGSDYDVDVGSSVGTIGEATGSSTNGLNVNAVSFGVSSYAVLSNALETKRDYTLYAVFTSGANGTEGRLGTLYGSASGETVGLSATTESTSKQPVLQNKFGVRHEDRVGLPATYELDYEYDEDLPTVIVIRRDADYNISAYNYEGDLIASIPALITTLDPDVSTSVTTNGETAGILNILQIGSSGGDTVESFKGALARFGVIQRDIGSTASIKLAKDLHKLYNL